MTPLEKAHEEAMKKQAKASSPFDKVPDEEVPDLTIGDEESAPEIMQEKSASVEEYPEVSEEEMTIGESSEAQEQKTQYNSEIDKLRAKFEEKKRKKLEQNKAVALYDEETEKKLTQFFGGLLPEVTKHQAYLTKVIPFAMNNDTPDNFSALIGKRVTLVFAMKNPNSGKIEDGYTVNLSYAKPTKDTKSDKDPANWVFEEPEGEKEKLDFLVSLAFEKYGVKKFEDLVKLNPLIEKNKSLPFTVFSYMMVNKFHDSTRTKVIYQLTNHGYTFITAERVPQDFEQFCAESGGRLPAKVFAIRNNENFRRYEVFLKVKDRYGKEHIFCQKFSYARKKTSEGRRIGYKQANSLPPDYSKLVEAEETITDKLRLLKEDWDKISEFNPIEVNISVYRTSLTDSHQNTIYAVEILS